MATTNDLKKLNLGVVHFGGPTPGAKLEAAFPRLTEQQIGVLEPYSTRATYKKGDEVWHAGARDLCMYVVVKGELRILHAHSGNEIMTHGAGSFTGDIEVLSGRAVLVSGVATTDLELLQVPADCVRSIVSEHPDVGQLILRAYLTRRALLAEHTGSGVLVIGSRFCSDTMRIREFLIRNLYPVVWEDLETERDTSRVLNEFHISEDDMPVVVLPSGDVFKSPSNDQLADALGIKRIVDSKFYDLVIVGAGPAGLAAAVYGASEGLSTLVLDAAAPGGQAGKSSMIENYLGFPLGVSGQQLSDAAVIQAEKFGATFVAPADVKEITCRNAGVHTVSFDEQVVECRSVLLAPGVQYRKLEAPGCDEYDGRGVFYEATHVERVVCANNAVAVVGGGNSAGQAAVFLAENASRVFLVMIERDIREHMSSYLARRIERNDKIEVLLHSEVCEVSGDVSLAAVSLCDLEKKQVRKEDVAGLFVMIGASPHTDWLPDAIARNEHGYILTGPEISGGKWSMHRNRFFLETSCPGIFAAGDARANSVKRVASAVGEGAMAVTFVHQHLASSIALGREDLGEATERELTATT
jgi:thioredoxin reductase (NADPH)